MQDDFDDYEDSEEEIIDFADANYFSYSVEEMANFWIDRFFKGQHLHCGGAIPNNTLHSPANIKKVIETDLEVGVPKMYELIQGTLNIQDYLDNNEEEHSKDVKMVLDYLDRCRKMWVPKEFASGIILMDMGLCQGIKTQNDLLM